MKFAPDKIEVLVIRIYKPFLFFPYFYVGKSGKVGKRGEHGLARVGARTS